MTTLPEAFRRIEDLERGLARMAGEFTIAAGPTATTVRHRGVTERSVVTVMAHAAPAANSDIVRVIPAKDEFTVTSTSSASARTYRYQIATPSSYTA